jgi:hypothetical protein
MSTYGLMGNNVTPFDITQG